MIGKKIKIVEVGPRDGLQNEKMNLDIFSRVTLIDLLSDSGLESVEVGSFVSPKFDFSDVYIVDSSAEEDVYGFSPLFLATDSGGVRTIVQRGGVGDINYKTGLVRIQPSVIQDNTSVTFTARPESVSINAKQEMVLNVVQREVTITGQ